MVTLTECLKIMESSNWITLRYITADVNAGTGGKVMELPKCRLVNRKAESQTQTVQSAGTKNQNHHRHFTRNVELPTGAIRKVHPILITHINGEPVV